MAKVKDAVRARLKGRKGSKASTTARSKPSKLSEEFVVDSGSDDYVSKPMSCSGKSRDTKSEDEKIHNPKQAKAGKLKVTAPEEPPVLDDASEDSGDSDEESAGKDEEISWTQKNALQKPDTTATKVNGVKRTAGEASSSEETEESDDNELPDQPESKKWKAANPSSEEDSEKVRHHDREEKPDGSSKAEGALSAPKPAKVVPPTPYKPPPGYSAIDTTSLAGYPVFSQSTLSGKQIWHLTAPSNVPVSSITEVALDAIKNHEPVYSHSGISYVLDEDQDADRNSVKLFVLDQDGYKLIAQPIERTLQLQQHVALPNMTQREVDQLTGSSAAGNVSQAPVKAVGRQSNGLRMRYNPPGFGPCRPELLGSSDSSDEDAQSRENGATFQFPKALGARGISGPHDMTMPEADAVGGAKKALEKAKKRKRDKQRTSASDAILDRSSRPISTPAKTTAAQQAGLMAGSMANGATSDTATPEDKARRKEEKRLRREKKEARRREKEAAASSTW